MASTRKPGRIQDIVMKAGLVDQMQMRSALAHLEQWGGTFGHSLVELGFVDEDALTEVIGQGLNMQVMHLGTVPRDGAALAKIDVKFCEDHLIFPLSVRDRVLSLAMADPTQLDVIDEVGAIFGCRVQPFLASGSEILAVIARHYKNEALAISPNRARKAITSELASRPSAPGSVTARMAVLKDKSANSMLNEILGDADEVTLNDLDVRRLQAAQQTQEKAGQILAALRSLLSEKGYLP